MKRTGLDSPQANAAQLIRAPQGPVGLKMNACISITCRLCDLNSTVVVYRRNIKKESAIVQKRIHRYTAGSL